MQRKPSSDDTLPSDVKLDSSLSRSRRLIREYILCNSFDYFCTFTFDGSKVDRKDYVACRKKLTKWLNNFRTRKAPDFRYLIVPERHKDGGWHFHGCVRGLPSGCLYEPEKILKRFGDKLRLVPNTPHYMSWRDYEKSLGYFNLSRIKSVDRCAVYVTKYITKDVVDLALGSQVVLCSKDLNKPELVFDEDNIPRDFVPQYESQFIQMAYLPDHDTVGVILPDWFGCSVSSTVSDDVIVDACPFEPVQIVLGGDNDVR